MLHHVRSLQVAGLRDHRLLDLALELVRAPDARELVPAEVVARLGAWPGEQVYAALVRHGLHVLWLEAVRAAGLRERLDPRLGHLLAAARKHEVARSMVQEQALARAAGALERADVTWLVFKGGHLRRALYAAAHLRAACDVDILVRPAERHAALGALQAAGFEYRANPGNEDHEGTMSGHGAVIDLHWRPLRPGRARIELTPWLLAGRERLDAAVTGARGAIWGPSPVAALVLLLLHPAVTEHVTASLAKAVDLDRWLRRDATDLDAAAGVLERAGLRTAGWATLAWTRLWLHTPVLPEAWARLAPGVLRRAYLRGWLAMDPPRLYERRPNLVRAAFSLPLQDDARDLVRALRVGRSLWR